MTGKISKQILLIFLFVLTSTVLFSQINITGTVVDYEENGIVGVLLQEINTTNTTSADIDGKFSFTVSDTALIKISFLGYKDTIILANKLNNSIVRLEKDADYDKIHGVYIVDYARYISIGYYGDFKYFPFGLNVHAFRPRLMKKPVMIFVDINYKTNFESDYYFKFSWTSMNMIGTDKYGLRLALEYQDKQLMLSDYEYQSQDYHISFANSVRNIISFAPGLTYREEKRTEQEYRLGYFLSVNKYFQNIGQTISVNYIYFGDYSEYGCTILQKLSFDNWYFHLGLAYNGYREYNDFSVLFRYNFAY